MANLSLIILGLGGSLAVILLIVGIVITATSERNLVQERLGRYVDREEIEQAKQRVSSIPLTNWLNKQVEGSSWADKISKDLARADLKMKPGEYIITLIVSCLVVAAALYFIGGRNPIAAVIGLIIGFFLPGLYVKRAQNRRQIKFDDQLADMLNLMVNGLRAGFSTTQAMEAVSKELPPPISDEFRRVVQEMQLGVPMETALDNLLRRIPSGDLDLCVTAINVQREVGGNLAEILDTISYTIRERVRIKGEIRVLTSQVMYSGRFLSMMPLFVIGILYLLNREYMMEFFKPDNNTPPVPCGYLALVVAAFLIIMGYFAMNKLGDIEV